MEIPGWYEYFEERPFNQAQSSKRTKKGAGRFHADVTMAALERHQVSRYPWWKTREFENRTHVSDKEGVWPINHNRVQRYFGDPGFYAYPADAIPAEWPENIDELARLFRLHHYFRVWNSSECRDLISRGLEVRTALKVTEDWHDPLDGIIDITNASSPVIGSHAIPLIEYDSKSDRFPFQNSWGPTWGNNGRGALSRTTFDQFLIEAWTLMGVGVEPPVSATSGLVCLLWKSELVGNGVHGREIVDAASKERIGWTFLVRRDDFLDMEEFFVWPTHRQKGYGRKLAELVQELVRQSGLTLRAWIAFADASNENRPALMGILRQLNLSLHPCSERSAAFIALREPSLRVFSEPNIPHRPASIHDELNPENSTRLYTVWYGTNRRPYSGPRKLDHQLS